MAERLSSRVDWPYTKRCKGPAIMAVLRVQLKLGMGKVNLKKGFENSPGLKQDEGQNIAYKG
jgi:hypothetical protein